ncbi:hypothetical protein M758_UG078800 [Ceratodon purpureus]|nr:hypothetical protein M758_UG078800 [Ceratodon purpureus]
MADPKSGEIVNEGDNSIIRELNECNVVYFAVDVLSVVDLHRLEIPKAFTARSGWPGVLDVLLVISSKAEKEWPLQLKRVEPGSKLSAISIGDCYREFITDNSIAIGDLLVFEVVDPQCLVVTIKRHRPAAANQALKVEDIASPATDPRPRPEPVKVAPSSPEIPAPLEATGSSAPRRASSAPRDPRPRLEPAKIAPKTPEIPAPLVATASSNPRRASSNGLWVPQFCKTLRVSHTKPGKASRLDIPTLYWRTYGTEQFEDHFFTLAGPIAEGVVKSSVCVTPKQTFCFFTCGWYHFCTRNKLKVGDTLLFAKTGPASFEVSKKSPGKFLFV